jgi:DNA helicase-2/ATP-dependent DNA helicase PcrA
MLTRKYPLAKFDNFTPSTYQANVLTWLENGQGNGIVNAVAGSGKSTTLVWLAQYLDTGLFLAFNSHIARELNDKLQGTNIKAQTIHSLGYTILKASYPKTGGQNSVQGDKYKYLIGDYLDLVLGFNQDATESERQAAREKLPAGMLTDLRERFADDKQAKFQFVIALKNLCEKARITLTKWDDYEALQQVCWQYDINVQESDLPLIPVLLKMGLDEAIGTRGRIDFTDQIYLPVYLNLAPVKTYEFVMIDECQDLSLLQLQLVSKVVGGRVLAVGDPSQSMYGFAGAAFDSFWRVKAHFNCEELPLSVCYRCGIAHLDLARLIVPHILPRDNAPAGKVETLNELDDIMGKVQDGDLILCRLTAPLISLAVQMIRNKMPARVRGQDIGKNLTAILDKVEKMQGFTFARIGDFLEAYEAKEIEKLSRKKGTESAISTLQDKIEALGICATAFDVNSIAELKAEIEALFANDIEGITLSTIHRAKGDEAANVFIIRPDKLPLDFPGMSEDQQAQELNITYVALTRVLANGTLYIVRHEGKDLDLTKLTNSVAGVPTPIETIATLEPNELGPDEIAIAESVLGVNIDTTPAINPFWAALQKQADQPQGLIYRPREWSDLPPMELWPDLPKNDTPDDPPPAPPTVDSMNEAPPTPKARPVQMALFIKKTVAAAPSHTANIPTPKDAYRVGSMVIKQVTAEAVTGLSLALFLSLQMKG